MFSRMDLPNTRVLKESPLPYPTKRFAVESYIGRWTYIFKVRKQYVVIVVSLVLNYTDRSALVLKQVICWDRWPWTNGLGHLVQQIYLLFVYIVICFITCLNSQPWLTPEILGAGISPMHTWCWWKHGGNGTLRGEWRGLHTSKKLTFPVVYCVRKGTGNVSCQYHISWMCVCGGGGNVVLTGYISCTFPYKIKYSKCQFF